MCVLRISSFLSFLFLALCAQAALAKIEMSGIFSEHMVLQRDMPIKIWGKADPKEVIGVGIGENKAVAFADKEGNWLATLKPMKAGGPHTLTVVGSSKVEINDILIGEVWLCSGQSNMVLNNRDSHLSDHISKQKFSENMRFIKLPPKVSGEQEFQVNANWKIYDNQNAILCSAVATTFAQKLNGELNLPVGVIVSAIGGSPIQPWLSREGLNSYPDGRGYIKKIDNIVAGLKARDIPYRNLTLNAKESMSKKIEDDPARQLFLSPTAIYNTMIAPVVPYSIKGVLWYQGEANVYEFSDYSHLLTKLIEDWRARWNLPTMPFIYVQLAPYGEKQVIPVKTSPVAELRFAQSKVGYVPYTYMAVTLDCCDVKKPDWHSSDKLKIGNRLAQIALATQYNKPYPYKSPSLFTHELNDSKVTLHFRNTKKDLKAQGDSLKGFAIAGGDKKLVWAQAQLKGDSVIVWSDKVKKPTRVMYAWADNPQGNLLGAGNLPAIPFQVELDTN